MTKPTPVFEEITFETYESMGVRASDIERMHESRFDEKIRCLCTDIFKHCEGHVSSTSIDTSTSIECDYIGGNKSLAVQFRYKKSVVWGVYVSRVVDNKIECRIQYFPPKRLLPRLFSNPTKNRFFKSDLAGDLEDFRRKAYIND